MLYIRSHAYLVCKWKRKKQGPGLSSWKKEQALGPATVIAIECLSQSAIPGMPRESEPTMRGWSETISISRAYIRSYICLICKVRQGEARARAEFVEKEHAFGTAIVVAAECLSQSATPEMSRERAKTDDKRG